MFAASFASFARTGPGLITRRAALTSSSTWRGFSCLIPQGGIIGGGGSSVTNNVATASANWILKSAAVANKSSSSSSILRPVRNMARLRATPSRGGGADARVIDVAAFETGAASSSRSSSSTARTAASLAAALGIAGLGYFGATAGTDVMQQAGTVVSDVVWPQYVRERVHDTFFALGTGLTLTAGATVALWNLGAARVMMSNPIAASIGGLVFTMGAMFYTQSVPAQDRFQKFLGMAAFNTGIAFSLTPLMVLGGPLLMQAAAITGGVVGSLSFIAANSPSEKFLWMAGPLSMGLGVVIVANLGAAFFPAARAAPMLYKVSMYGGTALFSAFVLYDTSKIVTNAKMKQEYDAVNESFGLYLDAINLFTRIAMMLAGNNNRKR